MQQKDTGTKKARFYISFVDLDGKLGRYKGPYPDRYMAQSEANSVQKKTTRMVTVEEVWEES